jgi:type II secretory pathway pseudopilin PulG
MQRSRIGRGGWTLIELLLVITCIAILIGISYPAFISILERARKTQAANDMSQIVTAVNAYYTDYGRYPIDPAAGAINVIYGGTGATYTNANLFDVLRNMTTNPLTATLNPRAIIFIQPSISKTGTKGGIDASTTSPTFGAWFDPWGSQYYVAINGTYNNQIANPYTANGGPTPNLQAGVIAWSLGKDQNGATTWASGDKNTGAYVDDITSWQ